MFRMLRMPSLKEALTGAAVWMAIGIIVYAAFEAGLIRPANSREGTVTAKSSRVPGRTVTARTRQLAVRGPGRYWEVEVSPNEWKDCGTDCAGTLRRFAFQEW
jgi:hypothetical protein